MTKQRSGASRPELNKAACQRMRKAVRERDGNRCSDCGATSDSARLSVHHLVRGGLDTMDNLVTLCSVCHPRAERIARNQTRRPVEGGAPYRGPEGRPWSRHWFDY